MAEEIKDLIEKIQQEGVLAAENKAKVIEDEAKNKAREIIEKAKNDARKLIEDAQSKASKMEENTKALLKQSGRDLLLNLKDGINIILNKLIIRDVRKSLTPEEITRIITMLIKDYVNQEGVTVFLNNEDYKMMEQGFLDELGEEIKKGITLKPSEDIAAGFIISYDQGKSFFDFSDKALAEYISLCLKPKLAAILKDI
ncbi:MAG: hypothetical protein ABIH18_06400 [Candidatus Omnitrophota bacterium]